jgi:hypothetical protein
MAGTVTIASVRAHGVRQLLVYCLDKREGDWPCHHQGKLPIDRFQAEEVLSVHRTCPLSRVKRTCLFAARMSSYDPKRT